MKCLKCGEDCQGLCYSRTPVLVCQMLTNPTRGVYTEWTWWSDGTQSERKIPKGLIMIPLLVGELW